jgi:DNA-binding transcriptional regulator YiaG
MSEFKKYQTAAKISNVEFSRRFGVTSRTVINWRNGRTEAPRAAILLLQCIALNPSYGVVEKPENK